MFFYHFNIDKRKKYRVLTIFAAQNSIQLDWLPMHKCYHTHDTVFFIQRKKNPNYYRRELSTKQFTVYSWNVLSLACMREPFCHVVVHLRWRSFSVSASERMIVVHRIRTKSIEQRHNFMSFINIY